MARSTEYPDLEWIPPRYYPQQIRYGKGRSSKGVRLIVIHYTAGSETSLSAEQGARYNQTRDDNVSTHYFVDQNSTVQCVLTKDRAHTARNHGNEIGIQYELCGTVQTRAQWLDTASRNTLRLAAKQIARDCKKYGIPVKKLSVKETRNAYYGNLKGICGHGDCTLAFPEDNGDHMDPDGYRPGSFPWDVLLADINMFMSGGDALMAVTDAQWKALTDQVAGIAKAMKYVDARVASVAFGEETVQPNPAWLGIGQEMEIVKDIHQIKADVTALKGAGTPTPQPLDYDALAKALIARLSAPSGEV